MWNQHRQYLIQLLEKYMYGKPKLLDWKMNSILVENGPSHQGLGYRNN